MNIFAISLLPLGVVQILHNTQAFWATGLGYWCNKESFHPVEGIGIIACFIGVVLIGMSSNQKEAQEEVEIPDSVISDILPTNEKAVSIIGIALMIFVAFNDASLNVMARTMKDVHFSLLQFWFGASGVIILIIY